MFSISNKLFYDSLKLLPVRSIRCYLSAFSLSYTQSFCHTTLFSHCTTAFLNLKNQHKISGFKDNICCHRALGGHINVPFLGEGLNAYLICPKQQAQLVKH